MYFVTLSYPAVKLTEIHTHQCSWHVKVLSYKTSFPGLTLNTNLQTHLHNVVMFTSERYVDNFMTLHSGEIAEA